MSREPRCKTVDFSWVEFLRDEHVQEMEATTLGLYVRLLGAARESEKVGFIRGTETTMRGLSRASESEWRECGKSVLARFHCMDGGYLHSRTRKDYEAESERIKRRSAHAKTAIQARWSQRDNTPSNTRVIPSDTLSFTPSLLESKEEPKTLVPSGRTGLEKKLRKSIEYTEEFRLLWEAYTRGPHSPGRSSKEESFLRWKKLEPHPAIGEVLAGLTAYQGSAEWKKNGGEFVPALEKWIKRRAWESAPAVSRSSELNDEWMRLVRKDAL